MFSLTAFVLAMISALVAFTAVRRSPFWASFISVPSLFLAFLLLTPAIWRVQEYDDYPGPEISTLNAPCAGGSAARAVVVPRAGSSTDLDAFGALSLIA
ncbi:hypothetical protein [Actinomadura sp. 3N508]|uniref:hypothetical protein n=1 Tax=Actinomadura sp. 3N508 TaxID=3375153 RepID=UPI0037B2A61D